MRLTWPLTGRSEEMRTIQAAISDPSSCGIIVCGSAGVGKSRIAREALNTAESQGCAVRWIVGTTAARALPLGALESWTGPASSDSLHLVHGVIESLTAAAAGTTVVIGVDDAHLLDDLSAFAVNRIALHGTAKLILTIRDGERIPVATSEIWRSGQFDRLDLQPLSRYEITTLVAATLGGPLDPDAADRLWKLTRGNVLYLRNIVEQEVADNRLAARRGCWRWIGDPILPPGLVELIESRIGALPNPVSEVIDVLAVGEPLELAALSRITGPAAVEEADTRGLITVERTGGGMEVRVAHPLYGEVRRRRAAPTRLRRLRGLVAAELATSADRDDTRVVVRRATLSLDSDRDPEASLLVRAAQGAVWLTDLPLADRLAAAAIRAGGGADANFVRGYVLSSLGRGPEADAVFAAVSAGELTDADRARLAFLRAINRLFTLADPAGAKSLIDCVSQTTPQCARSCIDAFLTVYWAAMGKPEAARQSWSRFVWDQLPDLVAARVSAWAITVACAHSGHTTDAVTAAEAGYPVPIRGFLIIGDAHVSALLLAGRIKDAQDTAQLLWRKAGHLPLAVRMLTPVVGRAALGAGLLDIACPTLKTVVEVLSVADEVNGWGYRCQLSWAISLAMRGAADDAAAALAGADAKRHPAWRYLDYEFAIASAWVLACQGAVTQAVATVLSAAETARASGQFAAEVLCLQTATQWGDGSGAPRLGELAAIVEGPRAGLAARFAAALHAWDGDALCAVSADFEQMGDLIAALDASAHAANAFRRQNLRGSALGCSTRAEALATRCGGASTPALRRASLPLPLTDREREIAMLIGDGLSSREVARRLTLSVRTVEGHVYRAMVRTGVTSREELAALLSPRKPRSGE